MRLRASGLSLIKGPYYSNQLGLRTMEDIVYVLMTETGFSYAEEGDMVYNVFKELNTVFQVIFIWRRLLFQIQLLS